MLCWCDVVHASLEAMLPHDVRTHQPAILELFFTALDYRAEHSDTKVGHCPSPAPPLPCRNGHLLPHSLWTR